MKSDQSEKARRGAPPARHLVSTLGAAEGRGGPRSAARLARKLLSKRIVEHQTGQSEMLDGGIEGLRILLVEADSIVREVVNEILTGRGARVTSAANLDEALLALRRTGFDVLLAEARAWLAREGALHAVMSHASGPAILLTGEWAPDTPPPADVVLLEKPFSPSSLGEALEAALSLRPIAAC